MRAVIFDIDGTLLHSNKLDNETYLTSIRDVLGTVQLRKAWSEYKNVSGSGTLLEILADNNIANGATVLLAVEEAFVARTSSHIANHGPIQEVRGARDFVSQLANSGSCQVAYATTGWRASARVKLASSQFPVEGIPLSSHNDHIDKMTIMTHALGQLAGPFEEITYYGDGEWDKLAAAVLGRNFVPVGGEAEGSTAL
jgi:phosphoglycolate phosphatase-like HAD superfamily hydrolase